MLDQFIRFISEHQLFSKESRILLAVSGGIDSVVMTDLFHEAGYKFGIAHANFQLRGEESDRDEQFVRKLSEKYHVDLFVRHFETTKYARQHKVSIQVAARQIRYDWFEEVLMKHGYDFVATAHHLDDQIETFLINLARGTGISGLHGIPVKQGKVIRPLLFASRRDIEDFATAHRLDFVEDSSNKSDKYTRNRIRHHVIPNLEKINPSFRETLLETIRNIKDAEEIYQKAITDARDSILEKRGNKVLIPIRDFFILDPLKTMAYKLLAPYGFNKSNIDDIIGLSDAIPGKEVISPTHMLVRDREFLIIVPRHDIRQVNECEVSWSDLQTGIKDPVSLYFEILHEVPADLKLPSGVAMLDLNRLVFPLIIRKWKRGDKFVPLGMSKPKKLSDFFIDQKFSKIDKENQWLLCSGDDIVWVIGHRIDDRYKVTPESLKILNIRVHPSHPR